MTPRDALLAGIKTTVISFLTGLLLLFVSVLDKLAEWASKGNPPDLAVVKGAVVVLLLALATGVLNSLARYAQVSGIPLIGTFVDKVLGQVPKYLPPPQGPIDEIGDDKGESFVQILIGIAAIVIIVGGIIWISQHK